MSTFSVRFQGAGVASAPRILHGYIRPQASGALAMQVAVPPRAGRRKLIVYVGHQRVTARIFGGLVRFTLAAVAGRSANWAVVAG